MVCVCVCTYIYIYIYISARAGFKTSAIFLTGLAFVGSCTFWNVFGGA